MNISRRPVRPDDQEFQLKLYASTRRAEIAGFGWSEAQQEAFLRMQFTGQQSWCGSWWKSRTRIAFLSACKS